MDEYKTIKDYIKVNNIKPQPYRKDDKNIYFDCPFHDCSAKRCTIYPVRPEVCRNFQCYHSEKRIDKDRRYYDDRADINGAGLHKIVPFDLLFYDNPTYALYLLMDVLKDTKDYNESDVLRILDSWATEVPDGISNTKEIADAIRAGNITLEWE